MKYNFDKMTKSEQWFICKLHPSTIQKIISNGKGLNVCFSINGVEVDFSEVIKGLEVSFDVAVSEEVKAITRIRHSLEDVRESIRESLTDLNVNLSMLEDLIDD